MADKSPTIFGSHILGDRGPASPTAEYWKSLYYFNLYRLALAIFFITVALSGAAVASLGSHAPRLFLMGGLLYLLFGLINLTTIGHGKPNFRIQARLQFIADIALITLLMYTSGGVQSGLGLLMIVSVAAAGVVTGGRMTVFFAALATLAVLAEHVLTVILENPGQEGLTQIGMLGVGLFATAFLFYGLTSRISRTEALAERRGIDLANLTQLNELIIQRMQTGVLVVAADGRLRVINTTARELLGIRDQPGENPQLETVSNDLAQQFTWWASHPGFMPQAFRSRSSGPRLTPRFVGLGEDSRAGALIFLENTSLVEQQTQQIKLAALGRLTAAIAHEIRNPLGAISHANQLLGESAGTNREDRRLLHIISEQCQRMNQLVEDIMQLGRRDRSLPRAVALYPWLQEFAHYFVETQRLTEGMLRIQGVSISVCMEPNQLHQIVFNLCQNAVRHSPPFSGDPLVELVTGLDGDGSQPYLDVIDHGGGIPAETTDKIFEPFFTTAPKGTGLGLYIARELCEGNRGRLEYFPGVDGGSRFRISFAKAEDCETT